MTLLGDGSKIEKIIWKGILMNMKCNEALTEVLSHYSFRRFMSVHCLTLGVI